MSRAAHCGPPVPLPPWEGVADGDPSLDLCAPPPRGTAPEVDLVGALGLPRLLRQAQGLLVRRDPLLGHVPLGLSRRSQAFPVRCPPVEAGRLHPPGRGGAPRAAARLSRASAPSAPLAGGGGAA